MKSKLFALALMVVLTATAAAPLTAAPLLAPCAPGAAYDPACDVNHDGVVNVLDVQITAGHWNQTGTWLSDNSHNHLGQTWVGANNALKIQGAFGAPDYAPLVLNNTAGVALSMAASDSAVYIDSAGYNGLWVASAANNGLSVDSADLYGVYVGSALTGIRVNSASAYGVRVDAASEGVYVASASDGVNVTGISYAGVFAGDIYVTGNCTGCRQANFAVNAGDRALQPGDIVSVQGVTTTDFDTGPALWQVTQARPGQAVVGVVAGRAELVTNEEHRPSETGKRLVPREGAAQPGEYVTVVYSGPMQVKVAAGESAIAAGTRLTAGVDGTVRRLGTAKVQLADGTGTADMSEDAPVIGLALESITDGLVWVLVNPQ